MNIKRQCAWCEKFLAPPENQNTPYATEEVVTHTICEKCLGKVRAAIYLDRPKKSNPINNGKEHNHDNSNS